MADNLSNVSNQYSPKGATFADNLRVGSFSMRGTNTVGRGVPVGNVLPYAIRPIAEGSFFTSSQNLVAGSYMNLAASVDTIPNFGLQPDCIRQIQVAADQTTAFTATVSGYDRYGNKTVGVTTSAGGSTNIAIILPQFETITSVFVNGFTGAMDFDLEFNNVFELPYTDNGDGATYKGILWNGNPLLIATIGSSTPYSVSYNGTIAYAPVLGTTITQNMNVRPTLAFPSSGTQASFQQPNGVAVLTVVQSVENYGFVFQKDPFKFQENDYTNQSDLVLGAKPYSVGWTAWGGQNG